MKSILLVGLGKFGKHIALQLHQLGHQVMGVDHNEDRINDTIDIMTNAQIGDSTNEEFLRSLGVDNYDVCIVTIGNDFQLFSGNHLFVKRTGSQICCFSGRAGRTGKIPAPKRCRRGSISGKADCKMGCDMRYTSNHILDYIELDEAHSIFEVTIPKEWLGMSIGQIDIRKKYNINIIAVKDKGKTNLSVTPDTLLTADKTMLVLGEDKALQKCFHI